MKTLKFSLVGFVCALAPLAAQTVFNTYPINLVGQPLLQQQVSTTATAPNLVEGREFNAPEALALDKSASPPILYVADTSNNRILVWKNAKGFSKGDKADLVIGQRDFYTTGPKGPGTDLSNGLTAPTAVAVDGSGNLYVADTGNNRVVRYPTPTTQTFQILPVDVLIGQKDQSGKSPNEGGTSPNEKTLAFTSGSSLLRVGLAFDTSGNLWVSDPGNNRVLRYPSSGLTSGSLEVAADRVLGHTDFSTSALPSGLTRSNKSALAQPTGLAFDPQGQLYVPDGGNRVVVFTPPFSSGQAGSRLIGVVLPATGQPTPAINEYTLGAVYGSNQSTPPTDVFFVGDNPFVVDTGNARILEYNPYNQWEAETSTTLGPKAIAVIGQPDFVSNKSNQGLPQPTASTFSGPIGAHTRTLEAAGVVSAAFSGTDLFVVDAGNNRVMVFPQSGGTFTSANRLLGQVDFQYNSVNLIEGREFYTVGFGGSAIVDNVSRTAHLYVSDPGNNRVLGFKDARLVGPGSTADLVLGQPDLFTGIVNYPKNDVLQVSDSGLNLPEGIAVDGNGDVWVADTGNGRVLRYPRPFDVLSAGQQQRPNLVIGQPNFFSKITDASSQTMNSPYGIAFSLDGHLLVSDVALARVLFFRRPSGADFTNGQAATSVIGQPDFGPPARTDLSQPRGITLDSDDRLYVADYGHSRIVAYRNVPTAGNDPTPSFSFNLTGVSASSTLRGPISVTASQYTGELWVADQTANYVFRYPRFDQLSASSTTTAAFPVPGPLWVSVDPFSNPIITDSYNRVTFAYPAIDYTSSAGGVSGRLSGNGANYLGRFAPGMIASIFAFPNSGGFGGQTASASTLPLPLTLGDVQVTVGGTPAPLFYVSSTQINLQVPYSAPVGSFQEFRVVKASTGQILATTLFRIEAGSPGLFTLDASGTGPLVALNEDGTLNSAKNPAKAGHFVTFFGTGAGAVPGAPKEGEPNPSQPLPTDELPSVYINPTNGPIPSSDIEYSGLAPGFAGLWQINARVPANVPPGAVPVVVVYKGFNSRLDANGVGRQTTLYVTP